MKKSKAPLALMEQMVMLLVFALAAALCLQAFVKSDQISLKSQARSDAALAAQNIAEYIRHSGGSIENALKETADTQSGKYVEDSTEMGGTLVISYNEDWEPTGEEAATYVLTVGGIPAEEEGLRKVLIQVVDPNGELVGDVVSQRSVEGTTGELLFELETAWLEVEGNE